MFNTPATQAGRKPNRLYFGNLQFSLGEAEVSAIFQTCGTITDIHIIRDKESGTSQGYGFISFATAEERDTALEMNGKEFYGRKLKVSFESRSKRSEPGGANNDGPKKRLFVKGIPPSINEDGVKQQFQQYGTIENFFFIKNHQTGESRGFGFIDFSTEDEATAALALDGEHTFGQRLTVKFAQDKPQNNGRGRGGGRGGFGMRGGGRGGFQHSYNPYANPHQMYGAGTQNSAWNQYYQQQPYSQPGAYNPTQAAQYYATQPTQAAYGTQPTQTAYGTQPTQTAYGMQQTPAAYGMQQTQTAYGTPQTTQVAYGTPQTAQVGYTPQTQTQTQTPAVAAFAGYPQQQQQQPAKS